MNDEILFLSTQGMTTREIVATFQEPYGTEVSASLISKVTDAVIEQVIDGQSRPLNNFINGSKINFISPNSSPI